MALSLRVDPDTEGFCGLELTDINQGDTYEVYLDKKDINRLLDFLMFINANGGLKQRA